MNDLNKEYEMFSEAGNARCHQMVKAAEKNMATVPHIGSDVAFLTEMLERGMKLMDKEGYGEVYDTEPRANIRAYFRNALEIELEI